MLHRCAYMWTNIAGQRLFNAIFGTNRLNWYDQSNGLFGNLNISWCAIIISHSFSWSLYNEYVVLTE